ncbi:hypothetical protein B0H17DRAFT_1096448 [Mycena rosella]|uniref:Uncharacterized protein n=1 Tax=Mycena rosella TaxID=1033263 RepID=A0AAD7CQR1_MYCRO|nr:hypothetical protein B0H17DRAFT_1096448 [Mycena rosella]
MDTQTTQAVVAHLEKVAAASLRRLDRTYPPKAVDYVSRLHANGQEEELETLCCQGEFAVERLLYQKLHMGLLPPVNTRGVCSGVLASICRLLNDGVGFQASVHPSLPRRFTAIAGAIVRDSDNRLGDLTSWMFGELDDVLDDVNSEAAVIAEKIEIEDSDLGVSAEDRASLLAFERQLRPGHQNVVNAEELEALFEFVNNSCTALSQLTLP